MSPRFFQFAQVWTGLLFIVICASANEWSKWNRFKCKLEWWSANLRQDPQTPWMQSGCPRILPALIDINILDFFVNIYELYPGKIVEDVKRKFFICPFVQIYAKIQWVLCWPVSHPSAKFRINLFSSFCIVLLTNKSRNKPKDRGNSTVC